MKERIKKSGVRKMPDEVDTPSDATTPPQGTTPAPPQEGNNPAPEKTFSQADVAKMMTREKSAGRNAVYKELGIDPKNEASVEELKKLIQSRKSDAQVLADLKIENDKKIEEADQRVFLAEVKAEIAQAGVQKDYREDAIALITAKVKNIEDLPAEIENIKTKYPVWFADADAVGNSLGPKGTGSPPKPGSGGGSSQPENLGERLAKARQGGDAKQSSWE
jgi:hypothetical protein